MVALKCQVFYSAALTTPVSGHPLDMSCDVHISFLTQAVQSELCVQGLKRRVFTVSSQGRTVQLGRSLVASDELLAKQGTDQSPCLGQGRALCAESWLEEGLPWSSSSLLSLRGFRFLRVASLHFGETLVC